MEYSGVPNGLRVIRVTAYDGAGNHAQAAISVTVSNSVPQISTPPAPSHLSAVLEVNDEARLNWRDHAIDETSFSIERSLDGGQFLPIDATAPNITNYLDQGLAPSTLYYYRVQAINTAGPSDYSNIASVMTPPVTVSDTTPPTMPGSLILTPAPFSINASWRRSNDNVQVKGYRISVAGTWYADHNLPDQTLPLSDPTWYTIRGSSPAIL